MREKEKNTVEWERKRKIQLSERERNSWVREKDTVEWERKRKTQLSERDRDSKIREWERERDWKLGLRQTDRKKERKKERRG